MPVTGSAAAVSKDKRQKTARLAVSTALSPPTSQEQSGRKRGRPEAEWHRPVVFGPDNVDVVVADVALLVDLDGTGQCESGRVRGG